MSTLTNLFITKVFLAISCHEMNFLFRQPIYKTLLAAKGKVEWVW